MIKDKDLIERFLRYVKIDTQSDEESTTSPSTMKQHELASLLARELEELGLEVDYDREHCYVYGYLPGSAGVEADALGFVAHVDTSPAVTDTNVQPRLIENYSGEDELLKQEDFPELARHLGEDLIATDGTTLLGADDKAGVAEIMSMLVHFKEHPEIKHRPIAVAFTPDEELGAGVEHFDLARFRCKEAYTVDGGEFGTLEFECFNAAAAKISIRGKSVHPGTAKGSMVNANTLAMEFAAAFPADEVPEKTEGYEGFFMMEKMCGEIEGAELHYIIRDHDKEKFAARKQFVLDVAEKINARYPDAPVTVEMHDQYYNMREALADHMHLVDRALEAMRELGADPQARAIRGGTDGSRLSFLGVPCPNLCMGGFNYHSRFEFASVQEMELCKQLLVRLAQA